MIWQLDVLMLVLLLATAVAALEVRTLLAAVVVLTAYSFFTAILFAVLGAVDVALTEATLGAGLTGVLYITALQHMEGRT